MQFRYAYFHLQECVFVKSPYCHSKRYWFDMAYIAANVPCHTTRAECFPSLWGKPTECFTGAKSYHISGIRATRRELQLVLRGFPYPHVLTRSTSRESKKIPRFNPKCQLRNTAFPMHSSATTIEVATAASPTRIPCSKDSKRAFWRSWVEANGYCVSYFRVVAS